MVGLDAVQDENACAASSRLFPAVRQDKAVAARGLRF
jgi:hypothetical protein